MAILALDIGTKKTGVALSQSKIIAKPLLTINHQTDNELINKLIPIIDEHEIEKIIIGLPISLSRKNNAQQESIKEIGKKIAEKTMREIIYFDETLTTKIALNNMKDNSSLERDSESARIILESYLESLDA